MSRLTICVLVMLTGVLFNQRASAQSGQLAITTPLSGAIVTTGQTISIMVTNGDKGNSSVTIGAFGGIITVQAGSGVLETSVTIPKDLQPGSYSIVALPTDNTAGGGTSISVQVESSSTFYRLGSDWPMLMMNYPGDSEFLGIVGVTSSGQSAPLDNSSRLTVVSQNSNIVTVNSSGQATASGSGTTSISATYKNPDDSSVTLDIPVTVPSLIKGDLNGDGQVDINDVYILDSFVNTPANGHNDARDLNYDGKIDAEDARILATICTYPDCATHP